MSVEYREYLLGFGLTSLLSKGVDARSSFAISLEIFLAALVGDTLSDIDLQDSGAMSGRWSQ